jgi:hypothetical protein
MGEELSIIIPQVNEYPQVIFTVRAVHEELRDRVDHRIYVVDNWCLEAKDQGREADKSLEYLQGMSQRLPWLEVLTYTDKLSHWVAKRKGVAASTGKFLMFLDAHVLPARDAIYNQFCYYRDHYEELDGPLHLPTTYHILESHILKYKLVNELVESGYIGYSFTGFCGDEHGYPFQVPCHTTDGCMITRELYEAVGGFSESYSQWGGGENALNFTLAILGKKIWVMPRPAVLYHHGEKRGYNYTFDGLFKNRCIAMYLIGGEELAQRYTETHRGNQRALHAIYEDIIVTCRPQRELIQSQQVIDIYSWAEQWRAAE